MMLQDDDGLFSGAEGAVLLETKAGEPEALVLMEDTLARMRDELDRQFQSFVTMRDDAARRVGEGLPETEAKVARADLKAAVEAVSVIVRTLEKVDQLQRQLMRDAAELQEAPESAEAYDALWREVEARIDGKVEERLAERLRALGLDARAATTAAPPATADPPAGTTGQGPTMKSSGNADRSSADPAMAGSGADERPHAASS
jgi:chaperonin cofactor prefoldin